MGVGVGGDDGIEGFRGKARVHLFSLMAEKRGKEMLVESEAGEGTSASTPLLLEADVSCSGMFGGVCQKQISCSY